MLKSSKRPKRILRDYLTPCLALALAGPAMGQTVEEANSLKSLQELMDTPVIAATKSLISLQEAPASVTVLSRDDIQRYGWRSLADALASLAGFHVYSDRIYDFVVSRGFALPNDPNSRILLLVDGHSMVEPFGYYNGHLPIPDLASVERIEVVRGPNSVAYGTNALFAVINVVTRKEDSSRGARAHLGAGSFRETRVAAGFSRTVGAMTDLHIQGSYLRTGEHALEFPEYDHPDYGTGGRSVPTANLEKIGNMSIQLSSGPWSFKSLYRDRQKQVPTGVYGGRFDTDATFFQDINAFAELGYKTRLSQTWEFRSRAYLDRYEYKGRFLYYPDASWALGPPYASEFNHIKDGTQGLEVLFQATHGRHLTLLGMEYKRYEKVLFDYYSENDPDRNLDQHFDRDPGERVVSLFASHLYSPTSRWQLQAGLHYDHYTSVGGHLSLRGSMGYRFLDRGWIKVLYGEAFRAPNQWELQGGFFIQGNADLKPENVRTLEILLDATLTKYLNFRQSLYRYEDRHTIQPLEGVRFGNTDGIDGTGLETELRFVKSRTSAFASFSYADTRRKADGARIEFSPQWQAKGGISGSFFDDRFTLGTELRSVGPRLKGLRSEGTLPSYHVLNLTLSRLRMGRHLALEASIYNLLDEKYQHPSFIGDLASFNMNSIHKVYAIPADGRSFEVRLNMRF